MLELTHMILKPSESLLQEQQQFWQKVAEDIDRDVPRELLKRLDLKYPYGVDPYKTVKRPNIFDVFMRSKRLHPTKVVIVKVSYELSCQCCVLRYKVTCPMTLKGTRLRPNLCATKKKLQS